MTEKRELSREGWERHEQSKRVAAPLTEEEEVLKGVKDAEAEARVGTGGKRAQFGTGASLKIDGEVRRQLEDLRQGGGDNLVQLVRSLSMQRKDKNTAANAAAEDQYSERIN